jgi:hypothetical protein
MKMGTMKKEVIHQIIPVSVTGNIHNRDIADNNCSCGFQIEDSFDRSTTASDCFDANRGRFDDWAPTMDESDAFEREVDNAKEALASKLAVILFMECEARIDDWSDRELMSRLLALVSGFVIRGGQR